MTFDSITKHAANRALDRGITPSMLDAVYCFGDMIYAKGSLYYFMSGRAVRRMLRVFQPDNPDKYHGLVAVCDPVQGTLITCFKNRNWTKKIRGRK